MESTEPEGLGHQMMLLVVAGVFMLGAFVCGLDPWAIFESPRNAAVFAAASVASLLLAWEVSFFAGLFLAASDAPWYARPGGMLFLVLAGALVDAGGYLTLATILSARPTKAMFPINIILATIGLQLIWTAVLDPPSKPADKGNPPKARITRRTTMVIAKTKRGDRTAK